MVDRAIERRRFHLLDQRVVGESRVVHQYVDAADTVDNLVHQLIPRLCVLEIRGNGDGPTAGLLDEGHRLVETARDGRLAACPDRLRHPRDRAVTTTVAPSAAKR